MYCGVCHSDLHSIRNEWKNAVHPMGSEHEIVGRVVAVGSTVAGFKPGVPAAIGVIVDSCRQCAKCRSGEDHFCEKDPVETYKSIVSVT
jgi:uncharacterized zinc-type alcohol dehydrogenase-like protein